MPASRRSRLSRRWSGLSVPVTFPPQAKPSIAGRYEESPASPSPLRIGYVGCIPLITGHIGITVGSQKCHTGHQIL